MAKLGPESPRGAPGEVPGEARQRWLQTFLETHGGIAGTVHVLRNEQLELEASVNIPPSVQERTRQIPRGKGMAGLAWERGQPVQTCNLQTDRSGDVRPGARAVAAQAAVALPVFCTGATAALRAVVGIAFAHERDLEAPELERLARAAAALP